MVRMYLAVGCCCELQAQLHMLGLGGIVRVPLSKVVGSKLEHVDETLMRQRSHCRAYYFIICSGHRQVGVRRQVNYWPSNVEHTEEVESDRFTSSMQPIMGVPTKEDLPPVEGGIGDFFQAGERIRQMDEGRRGPWARALPGCPQPWWRGQRPYAPCVGKLVHTRQAEYCFDRNI